MDHLPVLAITHIHFIDINQREKKENKLKNNKL